MIGIRAYCWPSFLPRLYSLPTLCLLLILVLNGASGEEYQGLYLGKLNTYFHQVSGDVYVVDDHTFLIRNFYYDGLGKDTYFWAGTSIRPSNVGFLVGNENGRTNLLRRYINQDVVIRLPEDRRVRLLKWLAVWDVSQNLNFGDIYIPDGFEPPSPQRVSQFSRLHNGVRSDPVVIINSKLIKIPNFNYDGQDESAYFFVGNGPQPNSQGRIIPNERGYIEPLGAYQNEDIVLEMPGESTVFDIDWLSVWSKNRQQNLGSVIIPNGLNIPPMITNYVKSESVLPNCEQLHRRLQLSWEVFGPQVTFELVAQVDADDYVAIGLAGPNLTLPMDGADVSINYIDGHLGHSEDYNLTARVPCTNVLGQYRGVCPDTRLGAVDNYQINTFKRQDGLTAISFRRNLKNNDPTDLEFYANKTSHLIWAIGKLNRAKQPRLHHIYPKKAIEVQLGRLPVQRNCYSFSQPVFTSARPTNSFNLAQNGRPGEKTREGSGGTGSSALVKRSWGPLRILNQTSTVFYARLGVPGGPEKGYSSLTGHTQHSPGLVWYINGLMAPILYVRRGITYTFRVEGGADPQNTKYYHPLYLTTDANGGYAQLNENDRKSVRVLGGITFDKKGRPTPTAFGRLCVWEYPNNFDARKSDNFAAFVQFRNVLNYTCEKPQRNSRDQAGLLVWTPNSSTPDVVYYQSYSQQNMGYKIVVLDDFQGAAQLLATSSSQTLSIGLIRTLINLSLIVIKHLLISKVISFF